MAISALQIIHFVPLPYWLPHFINKGCSQVSCVISLFQSCRSRLTARFKGSGTWASTRSTEQCAARWQIHPHIPFLTVGRIVAEHLLHLST